MGVCSINMQGELGCWGLNLRGQLDLPEGVQGHIWQHGKDQVEPGAGASATSPDCPCGQTASRFVQGCEK